MQYRDYFDNHAPLFHMATAPLLSLLGERPDILLYMRAPMLLLWAAVLWMTWILARRLWSRETAVVSAIILSTFPPFFLKSLEYRTDNAWTALCLLAVLIVAGRAPAQSGNTIARAGYGRMLTAGLVTGLALGVSMKTPLIVLSLIIAWATNAYAFREKVQVRRAAISALVFVAGASVAPAILAAFFASRGAWHQLVYCVVTFNELIARTHARSPLLVWLYPLEMFLMLRLARRAATGPGVNEATRTRTFLLFFTAGYLLTLGSFWILVTPRDALPLMPLLAIFTTAWIQERVTAPSRRTACWAAVAALFLGYVTYYAEAFRNGTAEHITMMNQVLRLSRPGEPLMDLKGETIYRQRPFYYVFERITREAMQQGLISDTVAEAVVRSGCHVVQADGPFLPPKSKAFLNTYFMDMGRLRAAGQWLAADGTFAIAVPGEYLILDERGVVDGVLDGAPLHGSRRLLAGTHHFAGPANVRLACLWAPAWARGFSPFHLQDRDF